MLGALFLGRAGGALCWHYRHSATHPSAKGDISSLRCVRARRAGLFSAHTYTLPCITPFYIPPNPPPSPPSGVIWAGAIYALAYCFLGFVPRLGALVFCQLLAGWVMGGCVGPG